ncbi:MAG: hypothetical protein CL933_10940 [Deltaproteobacteria bacterium]|nr:hypothetical protein [Deltaproteobacteria bacterium]
MVSPSSINSLRASKTQVGGERLPEGDGWAGLLSVIRYGRRARAAIVATDHCAEALQTERGSSPSA